MWIFLTGAKKTQGTGWSIIEREAIRGWPFDVFSRWVERKRRWEFVEAFGDFCTLCIQSATNTCRMLDIVSKLGAYIQGFRFQNQFYTSIYQFCLSHVCIKIAYHRLCEAVFFIKCANVCFPGMNLVQQYFSKNFSISFTHQCFASILSIKMLSINFVHQFLPSIWSINVPHQYCLLMMSINFVLQFWSSIFPVNFAH